jgi:undecaprenyl-diphosphatase
MVLPVIELIKKLRDIVVREHRLALMAALSVFAFLGMASEVLEHEAIFGDVEILRFAHSHSTWLLDAVALAVTQGGSGNVLVPVGLAVFGYLLSQKRRTGALFWAASVTGASVLNLLAKQLFARSRPDLWVSIAPEPTYSFPSGHAMNSLAAAGAILVLTWDSTERLKIAAGLLLFVLLVGISRVYLGVHFPSDVLAGWAFSALWLTLVAFFFRNERVATS